MKGLTEVTKDALELQAGERRTLARILLELSEEDQDFSPGVEAAWEDEIVRRMEAVKSGAATHSGFTDVFERLDKRFA
jgi:hypothetical protein